MRPGHQCADYTSLQIKHSICSADELSSSFKDDENLLIVLIHLYLLHLIKLLWWSRIGSMMRLQGPGGEGHQLLFSGGLAGGQVVDKLKKA